MEDPSKMSDEELNAKVNGDQPETPPKEEPVATPGSEDAETEPSTKPSKPDETKETPKEETPAEEAAPADEEPEETPAAPSRREALRVEALLKKYGPPKQSPVKPTGKDYRELIEADDEVIKTLESDRQQSNQASYDQGLDKAKYFQWETLLQIDEQAVKASHPELDPLNKDKFHPALYRTMGAKYAAFVGYDPGDPDKGVARSVQRPEVRFSDFVESELEFADELASLKVEASTANLVKQVAQTGLRPDGSSSKRLNLNQAPQNMTLEELYASIGQAPPPK